MAFSTAAFTSYLNCHDKAARLALLAGVRQNGEYLPISLGEDLLCLDLDTDEKLAILEALGSSHRLALEHFLTAKLANWPQDLATLAIRLWAQKTDHLFWFRIASALRLPHIPQRVFYTIMDQAFYAGGAALIKAAVLTDGLEEMAPAVHGLLLHRAVQWGTEHPRLTKVAEHVLSDLGTRLHPDNKAMPSALAYLARFHYSEVASLVAQPAVSEPWRDFVRTLLAQHDMQSKHNEKLTKLIAKPPKTKFAERVDQLWPALWERHTLDADTVAGALHAWQTQNLPTKNDSAAAQFWERYGGLNPETLATAITKLAEPKLVTAAIHQTHGLLPQPLPEALRQFLSSVTPVVATPPTPSAKPQVASAALPLRIALQIHHGAGNVPSNQFSSKDSAYLAQVVAEEVATLSGKPAEARASIEAPSPEDPDTLASRKAFFDLAYRNQKGVTVTSSHFFSLLADAWRAPEGAKLVQLAQASRQIEGVMRLCYINTLSRFKGHDPAALKLLDFIRSKEEDELRAVLNALGGINTPRAAQELVAALTRPNITPALQLEACAILQKQDLTNLQNELRSAISDVNSRSPRNADAGGTYDVREAITALLDPTPQAARAGVSGAENRPHALATGISDQQLDSALSGKIAHYRELSSEVKRALRTSQFFHMQVTSDDAPESIDLSPVVDMQYKALELLFRETFEEACSRLINRGVLQRRLDVIGYARPIPRAMDEFEAFIAALPVVRDIPFFSKFKLRKMLRAICQYRPGKRFTLDGLKAFALFFLCFSRNECRYGLAGIFPLGFSTDLELFEFCKQLHMHQDVRNRAAHEGFHPDASSDIDGIWRASAEIVQTAFKAKAFDEQEQESEYSPKNRSTPIIEKKVS